MKVSVPRKRLWPLAGILAALLAFAGGRPAANGVCPKCGATLEPGAKFCTNCGARREEENRVATSTAPPDPKQSVVEIIASHDREMTSLVEAIRYGTSVRVDSLLGSGFAIATGEFVTDASVLLGAKEARIQ